MYLEHERHGAPLPLSFILITPSTYVCACDRLPSEMGASNSQYTVRGWPFRNTTSDPKTEAPNPHTTRHAKLMPHASRTTFCSEFSSFSESTLFKHTHLFVREVLHTMMSRSLMLATLLVISATKARRSTYHTFSSTPNAREGTSLTNPLTTHHDASKPHAC